MIGDVAEAQQLCCESITVCHTLGDDWGLSSTLKLLSNIEMANGYRMVVQQQLVEAVKAALRAELVSREIENVPEKTFDQVANEILRYASR